MTTPPPLADRAAQWNTYVVSVIPYRAAIHPPPPRALQQMSACMRRTFGAAMWCPWWLPSSLGP
eukprot:2697311-Prorocentrum_lima.AAC.1